MSWLALWAVIFWGFSFIATKIALREIHPFTLLPLRYLLGFLLLLSIQLSRNKDFLKLFAFRDWIYIFILSSVGVSGLGLLQAYGLLYTSAIHTGWIIALNPILITLSAWFFLEESITLRKVIGILSGFFGVFLIITKGVFSFSIFRIASTYGDFLILLSAGAWTGFTVGGKGFLFRFPPLATITTIMFSGCILLLPLGMLKGEWGKLLYLSQEAWGGILFLGLFCSGLGYLFWYSALTKRNSTNIGVYLYFEPLATLIGAILFLGEEVRWFTLLGGALILFGVFLATRNGKIKR
ncbi:MAG: DMT family transporter [Thermodesulfobacteriota bacterium]